MESARLHGEPRAPANGNRSPIARMGKRARMVCSECHAKKTKCDLQSKEDGPARCTKCIRDDSECRLRPSRRGIGPRKRRSKAVDRVVTAAGISPVAASQPYVSGYQVLTPQPEENLDSLSYAALSRRNDGGIIDVQDPSLGSSNLATQYQRIRSPAQLDQDEQSVPTNERYEDTSPVDTTIAQSYLGDSGFLQIFSQGKGTERNTAHVGQLLHLTQSLDVPPRTLQQSYVETYFVFCYPWCPVIEPNIMDALAPAANSPLLKQALALVGSHINPPVACHVSPATYYDRAKMIFHSNYERDPIICIISIILFYWFGYGSPNTFTMDTVFWWTGIAIRLAQQIGLHREPKEGQRLRATDNPSLRRRIWWTLFARERLTAISQGRPCMIDPDDCTITEPVIADFPQPADPRAEIFIYWVRLCGTIGRVSKYLQRTSGIEGPFPYMLASELVDWVKELPPHLQLPISTDYTRHFNRDVHQLHLPYLSTIILLHLRRSSEPLPRAYTAAVLAATCVARIFSDLLARGHIRFMPAVAGWYVAVSLLALIYSRRVECLADKAEEDMKTLRLALKELAKMWHSAKMIDQGLDRLLNNNPQSVHEISSPTGESATQSGATFADLSASVVDTGYDVMDYLPYVTTQTSPLAEVLLAGTLDSAFAGMEWPEDFTVQLEDLRDDAANLDLHLFNL